MSNTRYFGSNKSSDFLDDFMINKEPTLNDSPQSDPIKVKLSKDYSGKKLREAQRTYIK